MLFKYCFRWSDLTKFASRLVIMRRLKVLHLIIQPGNKFTDHVNISPYISMDIKQRVPEAPNGSLRNGSTPVFKGRYIYTFKEMQYKCESSNSPVELFSNQHLFNCATGKNIRVKQQVANPSICSQFI